MAEQLHKEFLKGVKFLRENKVFEGLPPEEVKETKKRIKEVNDQILGLEKKLREYEAKKALGLEEAELADIAQGVRDSSGMVRNTMMDLFSGVVRLGSTMPARVAGYGAHVVGAEETGKKLTQFAEDKDTSFEMIAPPAGADAGLVETIVSAGARSLAPSLMTGAVGAGVAGAIGKIPAVATALGESAKLAGRIDTAARLFATTATMSADEVLRSSTKTDEMGGVVLPENALPVMAGTLAHAAIENVAGITPFKMISQTKFANKFLNREGVRAIRTRIKKLGLKGAIGEFVKETVGEGAEEYMQGITEDVTAIFAHAPSVTEAVQASYELIADWEYHKGKSREFVVGAGVGALYSGMFRARAVIENKHASIEQKKEAMALLESARAAKEELKIVQQHLETMMGAKAEIARAELDDLQDRLRESGIKRYGDVQQLREELYNIVENGSRSEQPRDLEVYEGEGEAESVPYVEAEEVDAVWEDLIAELRAARDRVELEDKQLVPVEDVATKGEPTQGAELDRVEATQELGRIAAPEEKKLIGEPKRKLIGEPKRKLLTEPEVKAEPEVKPEPEVKAEQEDIKGRAAAEIRASDKTAAEKAALGRYVGEADKGGYLNPDTLHRAKIALKGIQDKDVDFYEALLYLDNKASRGMFEVLTGVKLPNTIKGSKPILEEYFKEGLANRRAEQQAKQEAERAEEAKAQEEARAKEDEEFQGFLKGKTTLQRANAVKTLELHGRKEYIDNLHRRGLLGIGTHEENKIKDPSRRTYNRWSWEQQQEHERRVREAGKKTVYEIRNTSTKNLYREVTKTEYEYAKHLLGKASKEASNKTSGDGVKGAEKAKSGEKIEDFGEKIGGARKDTADRGYKRGRSGENKDKDIPAWRKRYTVSEILAGNDKGKFAIFDANNKLPYSAKSMTFNTREAATMALPLVVVSLKHSVHSSKENRSEYSIYRKITQGLYPIKDGFKSAEEAKRYMVQNAVEIIETKVRNYGESDLLLANEPKRVGATRKTNVTTKDFADTFGFRGVEFGNWNNQSERQNVMDYAYAALQDLAEILKIPDKAISLNGELALAFGARGRGLTGARAHYEPDYKVINLTKMKGAGALAHEWFHALDHYLARQDKREGMLTEKKFKHPKDETKIRDELREVFEKVVSVISKKVVDVESEEASKRTKFLEDRVVDKVKAYNNEVQTLRKYFAEPHEYDKRKKYADKQELEKFDKLIKEAANSEIDWIPIPSDLTQKVRFAYGNEALFDLSRLIKKVRRRSEITEGGKLDKLGRLLNEVRMAKKNVETDAKGANKTKTISTDFYLEARELDRYRTTPYWSEVAEMAARAFSSYVEDKLGSAKQVSDFLSYGSQNQPYHKLFHGGKPFPEGAERVAINKALDNLFSEFKTKETESGIKLYSIEYLAAKYAAKGLKQAAKVVRRGIKILASSSRVKNLASSTKHFAQWARQMVNEFGQNVKKHLRGLYKELQNPTYSSRPRMGAISAKDWGQKRDQARKQVAEGKGLPLERLEGESLQEWAERKIASTQVTAEMDAADDAREAEIGKPVRAPSKSKLEAERKAKEKRIEAEAKSTAAIIMAAHKRTEKAAAEAKKALEKARAYIQEGREREAKLAKAIEEATPKTVMDSWRKALDNAVDLLADQWAPIKRLQEAVEKATGQKLTDDYNVYKLIETVQGRKSEHIKEVEGKYYDPIVNGLIKAKILLSDFNEYLYARAAFARNRMIAKRPGNPFALTGEPGSGMSDKEAQSIIDKVAKLPNAAEYAAIAEQVYALNNFLLDEQVRLGLITPQARDAYRKFGKDYVPLKRPPEHGYILDRSALGRRSKASNHLEYINQAITATYTRAFNREINQAVIKLFELTEQPLLYSKVKPKRVLVKGKKKDVIKVATEKFIGKDEYVWQRTGKNDYIVYKIHDEGLRHAIKGAKDTDSIGSKILNVFATNNKWMAFTATGGNPEFLLKNPIRDIQQAMAYTATHISFGSAAKFPKHLAQASSILTEHNLTGKENELLRAFKLGGGLVGYSEFYSIEQQAKDLDKTIRDGIKGGVVYMSGEAVKKAVGVVAKWNSTLETMTRFAAYLNAKEAGLTELSAIAHAKNVTVNFNKKGTMGHILNSLYVFAGANLGGNLNTAQILKKAMQTRKGQVMVAGAIALGAALEMLNYNIAGEDDDGVNYYDKIPNYVKDLSYVFMIPGTKGKYIAIPMPYGLAMLPAFGRNMAAYYRGGQHVGKTVANLYSAFMDSFNPLGGDERGLLSDAVPSAIKPFFDVWSNTKWTGKRLRPEQDVFGSEVAISELTYPSDSKAAKEFAKWLNEVSGGDRYNSGWATYFSPGELDHLVLSYTGGLGKFIKRSVDLLVKDKDEIELKEIPVLRVFYGEPGESSTHQTFRENVELVRKYRRAVSEGDRVGMKKMGHLKKADDLLRDTERRIRHVREVNKDQKKRDKYELALRKKFNKKMRNFNK